MDNMFNKLHAATNVESFRGLKEYTDMLSETIADDFKKVYGLDVRVERQVQEAFTTYKVIENKTGKQHLVFTVFTD